MSLAMVKLEFVELEIMQQQSINQLIVNLAPYEAGADKN